MRSNALLLGGDYVEGQNRQYRPVHGHGHAHLPEGNPLEEGPHVKDRVDGHPGHTNVAGHSGMVAVVAPVSGQVEGH